MTSTQQRAALQRQIWQIANDVRGAVDGWDFKQYVLGTLFYRFISENFASYIEGGDDSIHYAQLPDDVITPEIKDDAVKTKGYFIYPSQLFVNIAKGANSNDSLNTDLAKIFSAIESSANGYPSEGDIKGLFADFDTTSNRLGNTVKDKNDRLSKVLKRVADWIFMSSTPAIRPFGAVRVPDFQLRRQCRQVRRRVLHPAAGLQADCPVGDAWAIQHQQDLRPGLRLRLAAAASQETV